MIQQDDKLKGSISSMKSKFIRGQKVLYAENGRELRNSLAENKTQLLAQPGSAIAIAIFDGMASVKELVDTMNGKSMTERQALLRESLRILVQHRTDNGKYSLIGGARELTESFEATAFRELGEETGLKLTDLLFMGMISGGDHMINVYPDGNAAEGLDALYFALVPAGTVLRKNSETREFIYMTVSDIIENLSNWHPAQVATMDTLLHKILQIPEIYNLQNAEVPAW